MDNVYYRKYMLKRYHERINQAKEAFGGKCCKCGSTSQLELDHINRQDKSFTITKLWSCSKEKFLVELIKCQLLCRVCHEQKTLLDFGQVSAKVTHGTLSSYRYCHCALCKEAKRKYTQAWRAKHS